MDRMMEEESGHCCLVAIGRLQVTSTPNISDLAGSNSNAGKSNFFIFFANYCPGFSRHFRGQANFM